MRTTGSRLNLDFFPAESACLRKSPVGERNCCSPEPDLIFPLPVTLDAWEGFLSLFLGKESVMVNGYWLSEISAKNDQIPMKWIKTESADRELAAATKDPVGRHLDQNLVKFL